MLIRCFISKTDILSMKLCYNKKGDTVHLTQSRDDLVAADGQDKSSVQWQPWRSDCFFALKLSDKALILPPILPYGGPKCNFVIFTINAERYSNISSFARSLCHS